MVVLLTNFHIFTELLLNYVLFRAFFVDGVAGRLMCMSMLILRLFQNSIICNKTVYIL